jgi:hypothetical protein
MRKILNLMTDIETTDTAPTSVILTIGACVFDLDTSEILDQFYIKLDRNQGIDLGLTESADTLRWWASNKVSDAARRESLTPDPTTVKGYKEGLQEYFAWVVAMRDKYPARTFCHWANDPDFDLVKLDQSAKACGLLPPWQYWEHKSCRTMELVGAKLGLDKKRNWARTGTHHIAVDDAIYQATYVSGIWRHIGTQN